MISEIRIYSDNYSFVESVPSSSPKFTDLIEYSVREPKVSYWTWVKEESLQYLQSKERTAFFTIFLVIYIIAFAANIYAIVATYKRKHRFIQKTCIISLSISDLTMATAYAINHLETFSHPLINWTLGSFMCSFIPMLQIFGLMASCATLVAIALDRYRNVVHALRKRWNPELWKCLLAQGILYLACAAIAYPMYLFFDEKRIYVVFLDGNNNVQYTEVMYLCISDKKEQLMIYYICVAAAIFLPLLAIFLWLYYNIAKLVWEHRKPLHAKFQKKEQKNQALKSQQQSSQGSKSQEQKKCEGKEEDVSMETCSSHLKSSEEVGDLPQLSKKAQPLSKNVHVERKIRTFKIIITLMLVFFLCRMPYWTFNIMKLVEKYTEPEHWTMTYIFNGLNLLNCALNPFLYTFLNPTLTVVTRIYRAVSDFVCRICCCCISNTEFEEFEKENPFTIDYEANRRQRSGSSHTLTGKITRVKFGDGPLVSQSNYKEVKKY